MHCHNISVTIIVMFLCFIHETMNISPLYVLYLSSGNHNYSKFQKNRDMHQITILIIVVINTKQRNSFHAEQNLFMWPFHWAISLWTIILFLTSLKTEITRLKFLARSSLCTKMHLLPNKILKLKRQVYLLK